MPTTEPAHGGDERARLLIDVRTPQERYCGMGFIPGSIGCTVGQDLSCAAKLIDAMAESRFPVLVCLTGQRSRALALGLAAAGTSSLGYLTGGVLGWSAMGMPLAGRAATRGPAQWTEGEDLRSALQSELTQLLDGIDLESVDPVGFVFRRCALAMGCSLEHAITLDQHAFLDWVAVTLIELRVPHTKVATLLDRLLAQLPAPSQSPTTDLRLGVLYEH